MVVLVLLELSLWTSWLTPFFAFLLALWVFVVVGAGLAGSEVLVELYSSSLDLNQQGKLAQFGSASFIGGVPVDSEDAFADLSVQGFHWLFVPFLEVLVHKRAPHFTTIQHNWFNH